METLPNILDAIRKMSEVYIDGLSTITKAVENMPQQAGEAHRHLLDQWLTLARMSKDGVVTALNEGFELWERECRRAVGAPHGPAQPSANPIEVWAENWKKTVDAFAPASKLGQAGSETAWKQAQLVQHTLLEGMSTWLRLWQPPGPKP